ncbi:trypsin-like peptidase domain-containing protein [Paenisporosarcina sp.]|uniref:S1C family serine protease n=1 Tax=Paenisporosarcina sp. TaxID=1932001 RepID=UPI003C72159C
MKEPKRYNEPTPRKASSIKTVILLLAIALVAGFMLWLQFAPKPVEESKEEPPKVEETTEEVKPPDDTEVETETPEKPEGTVTYETPKPTPPEKVQPDTEKPDVTQPVVVEERVEERDQEAILASLLPNVYTVYTDSQQGSGFLYNDKGDIVTNAHVVEGYGTVTVVNNTGQEFVGNVIGISDTVDVALIRVDEIAGKPPLEMDLMKSTVGTSVIAIGSPNNKANTATTGNVTATGRDFNENFIYTDLYETDAGIAPGSSGGPLIDALTEKVIGINSIILTDNPAIGYSIPVYSVYQMLKSWEANPLTPQEPVKPNLEDAYFDEELLTLFIEGYMTLYTYAQNEVNFSYLEGYLQADSQVYRTEREAINSLKDKNYVFTVEKFQIDDITIEESRSLVTTTIETKVAQKDKEPSIIKEQVVYEVIIDEYGDYMIQAVTKTDVTETEDPEAEAESTDETTEEPAVEEEPVVEETPDDEKEPVKEQQPNTEVDSTEQEVPAVE